MKKLLPGLVLALSLVILFNLTKQIISALQAGGRLDTAMEDLAKLQKENSSLQKKLAEVKSPQFIEEEARNKLNFSRFGETLVIVSPKDLERVLGVNKEASPIPIPNWQSWLRLFIK